jgi:carbon storage regulator
MLNLTRKVGEKVVVGNSIVIEVLSVNHRGVRLGISAPRDTSVHRHEVFIEIEAQNRTANAAAGTHAGVEGLAAMVRGGGAAHEGEIVSAENQTLHTR